MTVPELWIIAGPNGAGKTTLSQREPIQRLIPDVRPINPDDVTLASLKRQGYYSFSGVPPQLLHAEFIRSAEEVYAELVLRLGRDETVAVETVLSTPKYRPLVEGVLQRGGFFGMFYVALRTPELAQSRVLQRARRGGHDVSPERVAARWERSLEQLPWFASRAHKLLVYDNSDSDANCPPLLVAEGSLGHLSIHVPDAIPRLTAALVATQGPTQTTGN